MVQGYTFAVKTGQSDHISNLPEDRTEPDAWPSTGSYSLCPQWSSVDSLDPASRPLAVRPAKNPRHLQSLQISILNSAICSQKTPAIQTISTHPTPKHSAIRTVPLCSALFRQKFSSAATGCRTVQVCTSLYNFVQHKKNFPSA